ncbi:MAG: hypothetical protein V7L01_03970 [Nostoc sp.]|uniref:hypothetical protein n=1 Tax=Nostoc sp. TaxID=1180 RepID=UPI002FFB04B6
MQSTLFTTLTPNEEANLSGGTTPTKVSALKVTLINIKSSVATNTVKQTATGGKGGNGGAITIGGKGKDSAVVIVDAKINSSGGAGGDAINSSDNAVGAG